MFGEILAPFRKYLPIPIHISSVNKINKVLKPRRPPKTLFDCFFFMSFCYKLFSRKKKKKNNTTTICSRGAFTLRCAESYIWAGSFQKEIKKIYTRALCKLLSCEMLCILVFSSAWNQSTNPSLMSQKALNQWICWEKYQTTGRGMLHGQ